MMYRASCIWVLLMLACLVQTEAGKSSIQANQDFILGEQRREVAERKEIPTTTTTPTPMVIPFKPTNNYTTPRYMAVPTLAPIPRRPQTTEPRSAYGNLYPTIPSVRYSGSRTTRDPFPPLPTISGNRGGYTPYTRIIPIEIETDSYHGRTTPIPWRPYIPSRN